MEHTLISNEPIICGKGVVTVLGNKSYLSTATQFTTYLTGYLPSQSSQLELDRCLNGEETVTLNYKFGKFSNDKNTIIIPVGPTVKSTLRPHVHEQWRAYIATHWASWYEYFVRRGPWPVGLSKRHKLVIVRGHIRAASRVRMGLKGCGPLYVALNIPSLKSQYEDRVVLSRRRERLTGLLDSADWVVESKILGKTSTVEMRYKYGANRLSLVECRSGPRLWARPATSPASISFDFGKADRDAIRDIKDWRNCLAVRAPYSKDREAGICFDVFETLSYHTTSFVPKIPLLGFSGSKIQEIPQLSPRSGLIARVRRKVKGMLRAGHEQGKDEEEEEADGPLLYGDDKAVAYDADA